MEKKYRWGPTIFSLNPTYFSHSNQGIEWGRREGADGN